jgi:catechol 2,3-dioxygenase-like lactoylglutathione lyase family enzyme
MRHELHHVDILTPDIEGSIAFYREKIGMQLTGRFFKEGFFDVAFLHDGPASTQFCIQLVGPPMYDWMEDTYREHGSSMDHYAFIVEDLDAWFEKIRMEDVNILMPPQKTLSVEKMYFQDVGGIVVELMRFPDKKFEPMMPERKPSRGEVDYYLNHISFLCYDLADSERFYKEVFNMKTVFDRRTDGYILVADPVLLAHKEREAVTLEIMGPEAPWDREQTFLTEHGPGLDHICFVVDDVEKAYEDLSSKGVDFFGEPEKTNGNCLAWFYDPNGVQIELMLSIPRESLLL